LEEAGRHIALGASEHVGDGPPDAMHHVLADSPEEPGQADGGAAEGAAREDRPAPEVERIGQVLIEDLVELAGPEPVGQQRGDHGARAAADVDVEAAPPARQALLDRRHRSHPYIPPTTPPPARARAQRRDRRVRGRLKGCLKMLISPSDTRKAAATGEVMLTH